MKDTINELNTEFEVQNDIINVLSWVGNVFESNERLLDSPTNLSMDSLLTLECGLCS